MIKTFKDPGMNLDLVVPPGFSKVRFRAYGAGGGSCNGNLGKKGRYATNTISVSPGESFLVHVGGDHGSVAVGGKSAGGWGGGASVVAKYNLSKDEYSIVCVAGGGGGAGTLTTKTLGVGGLPLPLTELPNLVTNGGNGGWPDFPPFYDGQDPDIPPDDTITPKDNGDGGGFGTLETKLDPVIQTNVILEEKTEIDSNEIPLLSGGGGGGYLGGHSGINGSYGRSGTCYPITIEYSKTNFTDDVPAYVSLSDNNGFVLAEFFNSEGEANVNQIINNEEDVINNDEDDSSEESATQTKRARRNLYLWIVIAFIFLVVVAGVIYFFLNKKKNKKAQQTSNEE